MPDTEDVAIVLYEWITGEKYGEHPYLVDVRPEELRDALEHLSQQFSIGIEDARKLLAQSKRDE